MTKTSRPPDSLAESECDVVASDGGIVHFRPLGPPDREALLDFYRRLSPDAVNRRFFTWQLPNDELLTAPLGPDRASDFVLGAEVDQTIIAVGMFTFGDDPSGPEVAFAVVDDHQERGIGTLLFEHLTARARELGYERLTAITKPTNRPMLDVFRHAGYRMVADSDSDGVHLVFELDEGPTAAATEAIEARELRAESRAIQRLLSPASVAVIGASRTPGTVGHAILRNIVDGGFRGAAHPVNPNAASVASVAAVPSVLDLAGEIDLAVIAVPADVVAGVLEECGQAGVFAAVIVTAGFSEVGEGGAATEAELVRIARRHGMRLVGPNCIGIINTHPDVQLDATFSPVSPERGNVSFASQSGALGITVLSLAGELGIGVGSFVSLGNKADVSGNDLLQFWQNDPETAVGVLYLESFGNPRRFARIARRFCLEKPLVVVKSGRTGAGRRAASSHTAAMASDDALADALFREAGIIRVDTLAQLFDVTRLLSSQPVPRGNRVAIVGNSGGPGILAADACIAAGLEVPELSPSTIERLETLLPGAAGVSNPVDLIASARGPEYEAALDVVLADPLIDAVIVIYTDPMISEASDVVVAIGRSVARQPGKTVVANFLAADVGATLTSVATGRDHADIPVYDFPEGAAGALGHAAALHAWRRQEKGRKPAFPDIDRAAAVAAARSSLVAHGPGWMEQEDLRPLLAAYGIELVTSRTVHTAAEAERAAAAIGLPVALKVESSTILHKSDVDGVRLGLETIEAVGVAYADMARRLGADMTAATIQPMAEAGVETIVGAHCDDTFGPVVMFGAGGTTAELANDRRLALAPVDDVEAPALIEATRMAPLLHGYRGSSPVDVDALVALVLRVGLLIDEVPEVRELDLNPVIATPAGIRIVDARCRVAPMTVPRVVPRRRLDPSRRTSIGDQS